MSMRITTWTGLLLLLISSAGMLAQSVRRLPQNEAVGLSDSAIPLVSSAQVDTTTTGDTIEVSERALQEALQEIARAVQLNELQQMVAEMVAQQQQLTAPAVDQRYEERFDRLERLLYGLAGRLGYAPSSTERRNLIVMQDGSTAVPYPVYPAVTPQPTEETALLRQMELLQEQIILLEQRSGEESDGVVAGTGGTAGEKSAQRLQSLRAEMQRLQQERADRIEMMAVKNNRADSLLTAFMTDPPVAAGTSGGDLAHDSSSAERADGEQLLKTLAAHYRRQLFFAVDSRKLNVEAEHALEEVAALLRDHPTVRVSLTGYASPEGDRDYNRRLARQRAEAAAAYLEGRAIAADRLRVSSEGVDDVTDMRSYGRRVDVRVF